MTTSSPRCYGWETWEAARWARIRPETDVPESAAGSRADLQTLCWPFPSYTASETHNASSIWVFLICFSRLCISEHQCLMNHDESVFLSGHTSSLGASCRTTGVLSANSVCTVFATLSRVNGTGWKQTCGKEKCQKKISLMIYNKGSIVGNYTTTQYFMTPGLLLLEGFSSFEEYL